jgi:hypothetical protein
MVFFELWVGWAMKYTIGTEVGSPVQRWGRANLGEGRTRANHGGWVPH